MIACQVCVLNDHCSDPGTDVYSYPLAPEIIKIENCPIDVDPATFDCPTSGRTPGNVQVFDLLFGVDGYIFLVLTIISFWC